MINNKFKILLKPKTIVKSNKKTGKIATVKKINKDWNRQENKCTKKKVQTQIQIQTITQTQVHPGKATTQKSTSKRTISITKTGRTTTMIREMIRKRKKKKKKLKKRRLFWMIMIFQALADPLTYLLLYFIYNIYINRSMHHLTNY